MKTAQDVRKRECKIPINIIVGYEANFFTYRVDWNHGQI